MTEPAKRNENAVSLRELMEARIEAVEKAIAAAKDAADFRLAGMNEFRRQIESEREMYVPRGEYLIAKEALERSVHQLELARANQEGKASQTSVFGAYVVAIIGWLIGIGFGIAGLVLR